MLVKILERLISDTLTEAVLTHYYAQNYLIIAKISHDVSFFCYICMD